MVAVLGLKYNSTVRTSLMKFLLVSILHHSEPVDPELMTWVINMLKQIFHLSPWHFAIAVGVVIIAVPVGLILLRHIFGYSEE